MVLALSVGLAALTPTANAAGDDGRAARRSGGAQMRSAATETGTSSGREPSRSSSAGVGDNVRMNQDAGPAPQNEIHIAVNPVNADNAVGGANDYRLGFGGSGFYATMDGGATWDDGILPMPTGVDSGGDPVLRFNRDGSKLFYAQLAFEQSGTLGGCDGQSGVYLSRSTTGGTTWQTGTVLAANTATAFNDKPWLTVDRTTGISGKSGNAYVTYTKFIYPTTLDCQTGTSTTNSPIKIKRSTDGGTTFGAEADVSGTYTSSQGSSVAAGPDGTVWVAFVSFTGCPQCIVVARSTDGGQTFSRVKVSDVNGVDELPAGNGNTFRADAFPSMTVGDDGTAYVVWSEKRGGSPLTDVWLSSSSNGTTWSSPVRVNQNTAGDQFFPSVVAGNGTVFVTYLDRRDDPSNVLYRQYLSHSHDGGATWDDMTVASAPSDPNAVLFQGERFIGDYNGLDLLPAGNGVWTSWVDTRRSDQSTGHQDAFASRVTLQGDESAVTASVAPTIGVWGTAFTVSGRLTQGGFGLPGETVTIEQRPFGASGWSLAATTTTGSDGEYAANAGKPSKHTQYRARFAGGATVLGSLSAPVTAQVRVGAIMNVADSTLFAGQTASFLGRVLPAHPGKKVLLQQLTNSGWVTIQTVTLDGASNFRASARLATRGFRLYRAAYPTQDSDHAWNLSRNIGVTWS